MDKKGMSLIPLIAYVFLAFFIVLFLGVLLYGLGLFDDAMLGFNVVINGQNFTEVYQQTTQQGINAIFAIADVSALALLLGMILVMMIVGYYWGDESKRLWIIMDLFIIIVAFVISVYLQNYFIDFINSQGFVDSTVFTVDLAKSSRVIARLPYFVPIAGILIMIVTYGLSRRKSETTTFSEFGY